ncbi:hypothetical protein Lser_V15G05705 [Lactuca serriola]
MENSKKGELPIDTTIKLSKNPSPSTDEDIADMSRGNPGRSHWIAVKNILKYLRRMKYMFLVLSSSDTLRLSGYSDASFQLDWDNFFSQSGWVFLLNGGTVTWKSSKHYTMADSTSESDYIAASEASNEAACLKNFIGDL